MSDANTDATRDQLAVEQWLQIRKEEGLKIDPATAEVMWDFAEAYDPYGLYPDPAGGYCCLGRTYFARSPGSDIWVWFGDLPDEAKEKFSQMRRAENGLPPRLPDGDPDDDSVPF